MLTQMSTEGLLELFAMSLWKNKVDGDKEQGNKAYHKGLKEVTKDTEMELSFLCALCVFFVSFVVKKYVVSKKKDRLLSQARAISVYKPDQNGVRGRCYIWPPVPLLEETAYFLIHHKYELS